MNNMLVTGGCGFIGANFVRYLLTESDFTGRIVNVDKLTYAGNPENLADIERDYKDRYLFIQADICNGTRMADIFEHYEIDSVCHFAAESHVDRSIVKPNAFIQTNIVGTFNLLESARIHRNRMIRFHHISTDEVYGSLGREGYFKETTPYKPNSPYSASKAASDHLVRAYYKTYGLPMTISNCSNNYGPYQFPEKLLPLMISNAMEDKELPVYGDGLNVRDWIYVIDHNEAIEVILDRGKIVMDIKKGDLTLEELEAKMYEIAEGSSEKKNENYNNSKDSLMFLSKNSPAAKVRNSIELLPNNTCSYFTLNQSATHCRKGP